MTRARSLSQLANSNVFSVDANNSRVGIGSTIPDVKLDVGGDLYADNLTINNLIGVAATFSGVVSYEDVTNVDSVGMVTARKGIQVLADGINAVGIVTGTGFDGGSATISGVTTTSNLVVQNSAYTAITMTSINKTIVNREYCTVVTSSASTALNITITLPASPQPGWEVGVAVGGTFLDTQVGGNGSNIMGLAENMVLNVAYIPVQLVYVDANVGWRFF